ncbi:MAG: hypothetical protein ABI671_04620 [Burkholderiales bacterium]
MTRLALYAALLFALSMLPAHGAETTLGVISIKDGELVVLRETREFAATEGLRLRADDIVRSRESTRLARIETDDGTVLDLGPGTELLLQPRAFSNAAERGLSLYLLRGWLKLGTATATASGASNVVLAMPQLGVARLTGSVVVRATPQASLVFVESGRADVFERTDGRPAGSHALKDGDAFAARASLPGTLLRRPPADLISGLPRAFVDSLPRRASLWQGRVVEAGSGTEPAYASVAPWINAEALLRPAFVQRFGPLARDRGFRAGLVAELRAHPEWKRVLFPEKPKPRPAVVAAAVKRSVPQPVETAATPDTQPTLAQAPQMETP